MHIYICICMCIMNRCDP